jgi:hypothetical protein
MDDCPTYSQDESKPNNNCSLNSKLSGDVTSRGLRDHGILAKAFEENNITHTETVGLVKLNYEFFIFKNSNALPHDSGHYM